MNALSDYFREQAAAHRATAAEKPDDPRYPQSAAALEALAMYADRGEEQGMSQMRYLLEHHVVDGRFAWAEGQCGRSIMRFGFDKPVSSESDLEQYLVDRVHGALDAGRGIRHVFSVGIPAWHEVSPEVRAELEALDGVIVQPGEQAIYGNDAPLIVKNVPAPDQRQARERIAQIVGIEVDALGASPSQQRVI